MKITLTDIIGVMVSLVILALIAVALGYIHEVWLRLEEVVIGSEEPIGEGKENE